MKKIKVDLDKRSYEIIIGSGAIKKLPLLIKKWKFNGPVVVVSDENVVRKTATLINPVLKEIDNEICRISVPASEKSKSIKIFQKTVEEISQKTKMQKPMIVALGGGVVGDLAGFVASTYRRGVPLVQVPTTLLSQVDSSVGGKVGIDLPQAKNLIGSFCQPKAVLMDVDFLRTLPKRQISNGLAEVIKYGIIKSKPFFSFLEDNMEDILSLKKEAMEKVIYECASIKARVVEKDEYDCKDVRIILNFGHTLGHAVEAASGYSNRYNHGESVAIGMLLAGEVAVRLEMMKKDSLEKIKSLIFRAGLPVKVKGLAIGQIMEAYGYDKKFIAGTNRFVLPKSIGAVEIVEDIPELLVKTVLRGSIL